jgi:hypothetical protein
MDKSAFILLSTILAAGGVSAEAYRWVDSDGVVHYSDRPEPGAEEVELPEANTTTVRRYANTARPSSRTEQNKDTNDSVGYASLEIAAPAAEETLWNIEGVLNVSVALSPALQPGHQLRVTLDGKTQSTSGMSLTIQEVYRGVHNLQAEIVNQDGKSLIRSKSVRFYVQQNSVRN